MFKRLKQCFSDKMCLW